MQKYRADISEQQPDGAVVWFAKWIGGPSLAKIDNCRLHMAGDPRAITGDEQEALADAILAKLGLPYG